MDEMMYYWGLRIELPNVLWSFSRGSGVLGKVLDSFQIQRQNHCKTFILIARDQENFYLRKHFQNIFRWVWLMVGGGISVMTGWHFVGNLWGRAGSDLVEAVFPADGRPRLGLASFALRERVLRLRLQTTCKVKCKSSMWNVSPGSPGSSVAVRNATSPSHQGWRGPAVLTSCHPAIWPHCLQTYPRSLSQCQRRRKGISISQSAPLDLELEVRTYRTRAIGKTWRTFNSHKLRRES